MQISDIPNRIQKICYEQFLFLQTSCHDILTINVDLQIQPIIIMVTFNGTFPANFILGNVCCDGDCPPTGSECCGAEYIVLQAKPTMDIFASQQVRYVSGANSFAKQTKCHVNKTTSQQGVCCGGNFCAPSELCCSNSVYAQLAGHISLQIFRLPLCTYTIAESVLNQYYKFVSKVKGSILSFIFSH